MDRHYLMKLLREAMRHPERLVRREKFWRPELFDLYLQRIDDLLFRTPAKGLAFARHAPAYAALHNLTDWAVEFGTPAQLEAAQGNLEPALSLLNSYYRRHFAKYKFRWLLAVIDGRLGHDGAAEFALVEVQAGMTRLELPYEVGAVMIDRADLYRKQGRLHLIPPLAEEAAAVFRRLGVEAKAQEALELLRQADEPEITGDLLQRVRSIFMSCADPMPAMAS